MRSVMVGVPAKRRLEPGAVLNRARSHWWNTSETYEPQAPLVGDRKADCCVVGGGINGLSTAYHLKKLDPAAEVVLLEAEIVGFWRQRTECGSDHHEIRGTSPQKLVGTHGVEKAGAAWDYVARGMNMIEQWENPVNNGITHRRRRVVPMIDQHLPP